MEKETFKIRHIYNENKKDSKDSENRYESIDCQTCKYLGARIWLRFLTSRQWGLKDYAQI